jgi:hypothetical protein
MASLADWTKPEPWAIPMGEQVSVEAERRKHGAEIYAPDVVLPDGSALYFKTADDRPCCGDPGDCTESCQ